MPGYKTLIAFTKAKQVANEIFIISKQFPPEEKFSLTDQLRRSSVQYVLALQKHTGKENNLHTL